MFLTALRICAELGICGIVNACAPRPLVRLHAIRYDTKQQVIMLVLIGWNHAAMRFGDREWCDLKLVTFMS